MKKGRSLLRVLRVQQQPKMSQSRVAKRAGMGLFRYWQIENGEGPEPSDKEMSAVAAVLGVSVSDVAWPHLIEKAS